MIRPLVSTLLLILAMVAYGQEEEGDTPPGNGPDTGRHIYDG